METRTFRLQTHRYPSSPFRRIVSRHCLQDRQDRHRKEREPMRRVDQRKKKEQGTSILEFGLVAIPTVFMMLGVVVVGVDLGRSVQVAQICRAADSMFVRGVPLYSTAAQGTIVRLGQNLNLQSTGGDGLVILSKIQSVPNPAVCGAPGTNSYINCAAGNYINVLVQRIIFGDTTLPGTHFPTAGSVT